MYEELVSSPQILILTILYLLTSSIIEFDKDIIRAIKDGIDEVPLPKWTAILYWFHFGFLIALFILNWQYTLGLFIFMFLIKFTPLLSIIGNLIMTPFKK